MALRPNPYPVTTVAGSGGVVLGSHLRQVAVVGTIDTKYRGVVAGTVSAAIGPDGHDLLSQLRRPRTRASNGQRGFIVNEA